MVALKLTALHGAQDKFKRIGTLDFDVKKPNILVVDIEYTGPEMTEVEKFDITEYFNQAIKVETDDFDVKDLKTRINIIHAVEEE